ncbi:MAG: hypothetical protein H7834_03145 [Magnetococcus sp. YQC-9]
MTQTQIKAIGEQEEGERPGEKEVGDLLPAGLKRPVSVSLTRMLAGRPLDEEILDPANPNLILDQER